MFQRPAAIVMICIDRAKAESFGMRPNAKGLDVHDGGARPLASFDHSLYCQGVDAARLEPCARSFESGVHWDESTGAVGRVIAANRAKDIVRPDQSGYRAGIVRQYPNIDVVI